ncbi:MAG: hypothetical protein ACE15B_17440 [Bryobacteraceae bacterium]
MFRAANGFKAAYKDLTLVVAADFDEWKVMLQGPGVCIHGARQFTEAKAKAHAIACAADYVHQIRNDDTPVPENLEWEPLTKGEWLNWRP